MCFNILCASCTWAIRIASIALALCAALFNAQSAHAQWQEAGPHSSTNSAPSSQNSNTLVLGLTSQHDPVYGAANDIRQSLADPNTYWVASTSGGIWRTADGGHNWSPTTDHLASLQFGAITLDASDPTSNTLYAGTGDYSAGFFTFSPPTTIYKSIDGGASWTPISSSWTGLPGQGLQNLYLSFDGQQLVDPTPPAVKGIFASDNVLVVAMGGSEGTGGFFNSGAMYRSTDYGAHFSLVPAFTTEVSSFETTTIGNQPVLLAARNGDFDVTADAVLASNDEGATWQPLLDATTIIKNTKSSNPDNVGFIYPAFGPKPSDPVNNLNIKVAVGPDASLLVAVVKNTQPFETMDLLYTPQFTPGSQVQPSWLNLGEPQFITPSGHCALPTPCTMEGNPQGGLHFALVADPSQKGVAYIAGSGLFNIKLPGLPADNELATIVRVNFDSKTDKAAYTPIVFPDASSASPHPDTRELVFDSNGDLLVADDGGVYVRTNPEGAGTWSGFGGDASTGHTLSNIEAYAAVMDPNTGRLAFASQDNGAGLSQSSTNAPWQNVLEGDGFSVALSESASGPSIFYATNDGPSLARILATDKLGPASPPTLLNINVLTSACRSNFDSCPSFFDYKVGGTSPNGIVVAVNQVDSSQLLFRSNRLFTWIDPGAISGDAIAITDISGQRLFDPSAWSEKIAYGTRDAPDAILAGGPLPSNLTGRFGTYGVYLRTEAEFKANQPVGSGNLLAGFSSVNRGSPGDPLDVLFDPATEQKFFIADAFNIYATQDLGVTLSTLVLPTNFVNPTSLGYVADETGGAIDGVRALLVGGTMSVAGQQGAIFATLDPFAQDLQWMNLGLGLPNADVQDLHYYPSIDTLVAALYGRGVWTLYDVTSNFQSATELWFGKAGNDSSPDPALLNGNRVLHKFGTGTLTLAGAPTYSGGTIIDDGIVVITDDSNLGAVQGGIVFNGGTLQITGSVSTTRSVTLNATGTFDAEADVRWAGSIAGNGDLQKIGPAKLTLTGSNTYRGGTAVLEGTLAVGSDTALGDPAGQVGVDGAALLATAAFSTARSVVFGGDGGAVDTAGFMLTGSGIWAAQGPVTKLGTGRLVLSTLGWFQGLQVAAGTLQVDGALTAASLSVAQSATLSGTGTLSATVAVVGAVAPGTNGTAGTLTINGAVGLGAGSSTVVDVGVGSDLLKVNGALTVGGTLIVNPLVTVQQTSSYTVVWATSISGAYAAVTDTLPGVLFPTVTQVGQAEIVSFKAGSFVTLLAGAGTADQTQIASGLDAARAAHYNDLLPLYQAIDPLSGTTLGQALENLAPDAQRTASLVGEMDANAVDNMVLQHMGNVGANAQTASLSVDGEGIKAALNNATPSSIEAMQLMTFGQGITTNPGGGNQAVQTTGTAAGAVSPHAADGMWLPGGASGFLSGSALQGSVAVGGGGGRADVRGMVLGGGLDMPVGDGFTVGAVLAYADASAVPRSSPNRLQSDSIQGGVYVRYDWDNWHAQAFGVYGRQTMTTRRLVIVGGTTFSLTGHAGGDTPSIGAYVGRSFHIDTINGAPLTLTPNFSLTYLGSKVDPFTETGGAAAMTFAGFSESSLASRLGIDAKMAFDLAGIRLVPNVHAAWVDDFEGNNGSIQAAFAAGPGLIMTFAMAARDRSYGEMGVGLDASFGDFLGTDAVLSGRYDANTRSDIQYGAWTGRLTIHF